MKKVITGLIVVAMVAASGFAASAASGETYFEQTGRFANENGRYPNYSAKYAHGDNGHSQHYKRDHNYDSEHTYYYTEHQNPDNRVSKTTVYQGGVDQGSSLPSRPATKEPKAPTSKRDGSSDVPTSTTARAVLEPVAAQEMIRQVNAQRTAAGLGVLKVDADLDAAALVRAQEITLSWSHNRPDGTVFTTVSPLVKAENMAKGFNTSSKVLEAWTGSEEHCTNLMNPAYTTTAVAAVEMDDGWYWIQLFS